MRNRTGESANDICVQLAAAVDCRAMEVMGLTLRLEQRLALL